MGKYVKVEVRKNARKYVDKDLIPLTCEDCGKSFELSYGRYRRVKNNTLRCKDCGNKYKSETYKERYNNLSDKEKENYVKGFKGYYDNLSEEDKRKWAEESFINKNKYWKKMSEEDRIKFGNKVREGHKNRNIEYKIATSKKISEAQKKSWESLTYDEKVIKMKHLFDGSKKFWENITDEERLDIYRRISEGLKKYYASEDEEHKKARYNKIVSSNSLYWNNKTDKEKVEQMRRIWSNQLRSLNEIMFEIILEDLGMILGPDYSTTFNTFDVGYIHPNFYNVFPKSNPENGYDIIPYHQWDFKINSKNGNDILIDIDGSIHNLPDKPFEELNKFNKYIYFNDSQRPYQIPDNMDAYIIENPKDELSRDLKVVKLISGSTEVEELTLKDLIDRIKISQININLLSKI